MRNRCPAAPGTSAARICARATSRISATGESPRGGALPSRNALIYDRLSPALRAMRGGPMMKLGLIAASSRPLSREMSHAARSASFLERRYKSRPLSLLIVELVFQSSSSNAPFFSLKEPIMAPTEDVITARCTPARTAARRTMLVPFTAGSMSCALASVMPSVTNGDAVWKTYVASRTLSSYEPSSRRLASTSSNLSFAPASVRRGCIRCSRSRANDRTVPLTLYLPLSRSCATISVAR
mmetsp:Transcript_5900/g.9450  ORF Transcript_5900/g.9450 Transcript_5900/m.9450 type:complete len:240 (-) Transcript_5900:63-782(-)